MIADQIAKPETPNALYACPQTRQRLDVQGDALRCGEQSYAIRNGIPQFLHFPPAHDMKDAQALSKLVDLARQDGWQAALQQVYGENSELYRYVTTPSRASFLDLLPLRADSIALEIGPGLGQFLPITASRVKWLYALEINPSQAEFAAARCAQENAHNVSIACGGDDCRLPYLDNSFDVILTNLVFEWCGSHNNNEPPEISQRRLLDECHRVLKPGGALWLATKNRYALRGFFGKPDEHAFNMRFGNVLPRWLMNLRLRLRGKKYPEGVLYSHNRLAKMLRESRLEPEHSFWAAPEMRYPTHFVPTDAASVRAARKDPTLVQGESRITRLLMPRMPAGWVKHFMPGLAFIARKRP
jgi:SAM-dependent methyltransferase